MLQTCSTYCSGWVSRRQPDGHNSCSQCLPKSRCYFVWHLDDRLNLQLAPPPQKRKLFLAVKKIFCMSRSRKDFFNRSYPPEKNQISFPVRVPQKGDIASVPCGTRCPRHFQPFALLIVKGSPPHAEPVAAAMLPSSLLKQLLAETRRSAAPVLCSAWSLGSAGAETRPRRPPPAL